MWYEALILIILVAINGLLSMSEIAFVSARRGKLEQLAKNGDAQAKLALQMRSHSSRYLSAIQFGITLIGAAAGVYGGTEISADIEARLALIPQLAGWAEPLSIAIVVAPITIATLIIGELVPKQIGMINAESVARWTSLPLKFLFYLTWPFTVLLSGISTAIVKLFRLDASDSKVTEEEIKALVHEGHQDGEVQSMEKLLVDGVFQLGDRKVSSLMTHRGEIPWFDLNGSRSELARLLREHRDNEILVSEDNIDHIAGFLPVHELTASMLEKKKFDIKKLIKKPLFIPESHSAYDAMQQMQKENRSRALIADEYGVFIGMIRREQIWTALSGQSSAKQADRIFRRRDGSFLVDGSMNFEDFLRETGIDTLKSSEGISTLAGFALEKMRGIPEAGDIFRAGKIEFEIVDMDGRRIDKLLVRRLRK